MKEKAVINPRTPKTANSMLTSESQPLYQFCSLLSVLTLVSIPIKFTGDFAFEQKGMAEWMNRSVVETHEQAADQATTGIFLLGVASGITLFLGRKRRAVPAWACLATMLLAVATFLLMARTANLGGQIRHTEIRSTE